jgi:CubicO group peptidase (beta-lactamase class C family)
VQIVSPPGLTFVYSGGGYTVAQLAVERVTGGPFAAAVSREVLEPLGMSDTTFCTAADTPPAEMTTGHDAGGKPMPSRRFVEQAAAGVCSTAADLGRFGAALMRDSRGMANPAAGTGGKYGLGLFTSTLADGSKKFGHDGANQGWRASFSVYPDHDWAVVVLTNGDNGLSVAADVTRLLVS